MPADESRPHRVFGSDLTNRNKDEAVVLSHAVQGECCRTYDGYSVAVQNCANLQTAPSSQPSCGVILQVVTRQKLQLRCRMIAVEEQVRHFHG
jgi:hypothetical protein